MRILGIDPGEKNIGVAISDPSGTLARPFTVIKHVSRRKNAEKILNISLKESVSKIIIGLATDMDGKPNFTGRKAIRLAAEIRTLTDIPVDLFDESFSTRQAIENKIKLGVGPNSRKGHQDDLAATIILQNYLDQNPSSNKDE